MSQEVFHSDPLIMGGTLVFLGTRVPVQTLLDHLNGGETLEEFLDDFPTVTRQQVVAFLEAIGRDSSGESRASGTRT
jgi:uncharacterized protein (DUF433 family)